MNLPENMLNNIQLWQFYESNKDKPDVDKTIEKEIQYLFTSDPKSEELKRFKIYFTDNGWEKGLEGYNPQNRSKWFGNITSKIDERLLQVVIT